ncbi:UGP1 [Symbiodinium sp. CCMP2592]|nr:UGP1 [Symbiodinium sp. CCMP2592]
MSFKKQREQIHAELIKDGIESPPPIPVNDGEPSEANEDLFDKLAGAEGLKGQTENHEACLCLPGTLHNPESQKAMSAEAEESEKGLLTFLGTKWHRENSRVNSHMNPLFATYEKEKMKLDKLLDDLHAKASVAESAATTLKESFHKATPVFSVNSRLKCRTFVTSSSYRSQPAPRPSRAAVDSALVHASAEPTSVSWRFCSLWVLKRRHMLPTAKTALHIPSL